MAQHEVDIEDISATGLEAELSAEADEMDAEDGVAPQGGGAADNDAGAGEPGEDDEPQGKEIDDEELDDLDDDDLDEDLDEDEDAAERDGAEPITRDDGAQFNVEAGRWQKDGKFVDGAPPSAEQLAAAKAGAAGGAAGAGGGAQPEWQPLSLTIDRKPFQIPEAAVQIRMGGDGRKYAFIAVPEDELPRFQQRIGRGVVAERISRDLNARLREVEQIRTDLEERSQLPAPKTEAQIEAELYIEALKKKMVDDPETGRQVPVLATLFQPHELDNLELKLKLAVKEEGEKHARAEWERRSAREQAGTEAQVQEQGLAETVLDVADRFPEFQNLTEQQLREVYAELKPYARALYWREGDQWFKNDEQVYAALRRKAASPARGAQGGGGASAPRPAAGKTGQPGQATAGQSRDDRFNAAQRKAAKPPTTAVSARRDAVQRPGQQPATRQERRGKEGRRKGETREQYEERRHRKRTRKWMNSNTLDFE